MNNTNNIETHLNNMSLDALAYLFAAVASVPDEGWEDDGRYSDEIARSILEIGRQRDPDFDTDYLPFAGAGTNWNRWREIADGD